MAYYQQLVNDPLNMQFYQPSYGQLEGGAGNMGSMGAMGAMDTGFGADVLGTMHGGQLSTGILAAFGTLGYPGEPPLLEELGINFGHIKTKTLAVLNPLNRNIGPDIMADLDLAGPILFVLLFGTFMLLLGKQQFGYIYGVGLFGILSLHYLFKFMLNEVQIDFTRLALVIGYCLLPLVFVLLVSVVASLDNWLGYLGCALAILWCTLLALGFFVAVLKLHNVRLLIAYPLMMFYSVFALMAIFVAKNQ